MDKNNNPKKGNKSTTIRIVALILAGVMVLGVLASLLML